MAMNEVTSTHEAAAERPPSDIVSDIVLKFFEDKRAWYLANPTWDKIKHESGSGGWCSTLAANWNNELGGIYFSGKLKDVDDQVRERRRELDHRPVDDEFCRSLDVEFHQGKYRLNDSGSYLYVFGGGAVSLHIEDGCHIADPTIGQFWTAIRLFGVSVKGAK